MEAAAGRWGRIAIRGGAGAEVFRAEGRAGILRREGARSITAEAGAVRRNGVSAVGADWRAGERWTEIARRRTEVAIAGRKCVAALLAGVALRWRSSGPGGAVKVLPMILIAAHLGWGWGARAGLVFAGAIGFAFAGRGRGVRLAPTARAVV